MRDLLRRPRYFSLGQDTKRPDTRGQIGPGAGGRDFPEDLWTKCPRCNELLYTRELEDNLKVCQKCGYHLRLSSAERIEYLLDPGSFQEEGADITPLDPIEFESADERYADKQFFDFGGSNEQESRNLNHGLLEWKEGFGARCCSLDSYEIQTANYMKLEPLLTERVAMLENKGEIGQSIRA